MGGLRAFEHDGLTFDYEDSGGHGDPVIVLHGYPGNHRSWDEVAPQLVDAGYRVLALDQRGYSPGARPRGRRAYTLRRLVGDLMALGDAAGAPVFHVVGHDRGGAVGWAAAAWRPDRVASMTTVTTPHVRAMVRSMLSSTQALRSVYVLFFQLPWIPETAATSGPGAAAFVRTLVTSGLSEQRAREYVSLLRSGAARPALNWYRAMPLNRLDRIGTVNVPVLYLYATEDFAISRRAADLTGRYAAGPYHLAVLEGASHWVPEEHADVATPILLGHLAAHPV